LDQTKTQILALFLRNGDSIISSWHHPSKMGSYI
jgi:hypothetical protein